MKDCSPEALDLLVDNEAISSCRKILTEDSAEHGSSHVLTSRVGGPNFLDVWKSDRRPLEAARRSKVMQPHVLHQP